MQIFSINSILKTLNVKWRHYLTLMSCSSSRLESMSVTLDTVGSMSSNPSQKEYSLLKHTNFSALIFTVTIKILRNTSPPPAFSACKACAANSGYWPAHGGCCQGGGFSCDKEQTRTSLVAFSCFRILIDIMNHVQYRHQFKK